MLDSILHGSGLCVGQQQPLTSPLASALPPLQAAVQLFASDRSQRERKRAIDKFVTLNVQQISATLDQVGARLGGGG